MSKFPIYLRVAKTSSRKGFKVSASPNPNNEPLNSGSYGTEWFPTVSFLINVTIPDELFNQAERLVAEINVAMKDVSINGEITVPKGITVKQK